MPAIGIDCRFASTRSGLSRYTREITAALLARRDPLGYILFVRPGERGWIDSASPSVQAVIETDIEHYSVAEQLRLPGVLRRAGIDLLFSPHFNVPFLCPVPFIVTVHDLILHRYPNAASLPRQIAYRLLLRRAVTRAQGIITVSAFSRTELIGAYGAAARKAIVIHEGVAPRFTPVSSDEIDRVRRAHGIDRPYFLYVGNAKQHKNVQTLIDAFALSGIADATLLLVTSGPETRALRFGESVRIVRDLPEEDLPALYAGARCFVSMSLYEGFGLPLLESHACGCPAIVTACGSFPEIAPPGTVLVAPDARAFAAALRSPPPPPASITTHSWGDAALNTAELFLRTLDRL